MRFLLHSGFILLASVSMSSCGDYRGASEPYSYAPATASSLWIPPKSIRREPVHFDNVDPYEMEDKNLSLAEVIDIALFNNPSTQESWATARAASAAYGQALQNYFVLSNLTGDYTNYQEALFTSLNTTNTVTNLNNTNTSTSNTQNTFHGITYGGQLNLSYTILDFGQTRATSRAALQALYEADFSHNQQLQNVVNQIMNDYYAYLSQKAQVKAGEQDVANAQIALDAVIEKLKNGLADIGEKVQATTRLLQQKLNLVSYKKQLTHYYTMLVNAMGFPANAYLTFENYPAKIQLYEIADLNSLLLMAMSHRPDLMAAESSLRSKQEQLKLAKTQRYPVVSASFEAGRENANLGIGSYYDYDLTISLNFPLFQGFFIQNGIKKAQAAVDTAQAKVKDLQLSLVQEVTNYFNDVSYSKETYQYAKEFLESSELNFKVQLEEYKAGTSTIVELINAQTSVANAQSQLIQAERQWYSSIANLAYATGALTNKPQEDLSPSLESSCPEDPCVTSISDETL